MLDSTFSSELENREDGQRYGLGDRGSVEGEDLATATHTATHTAAHTATHTVAHTAAHTAARTATQRRRAKIRSRR